MDRRAMLTVSLLAGGAVFLSAVLLAAKSNSAVGVHHPTGGFFDPPSPPVADPAPFTVELPRMPTKTPLPDGEKGEKYLSLPENGGVAPNGTVYPQITGDDALTTYTNSLERIVALQQRNSLNNRQFPPKLFYVLNARQAKHVFHPGGQYKNGSTIWGYDGMFPGPTFVSRYGVPILVRIINGLYFDEDANPTTPGRGIPGGFGDPRISTHLHNGHTGSESDGHPSDIYPPIKPPDYLPLFPASILNLKFRDHHYPMFRAGLDPRVPANMPVPNKTDGQTAESLCTLWYHDHSMDHTAANVYKGLVGFHLIFDDIDSGNENDPSPCALQLPSGEFDIPLLIQDKRFDSNGQLILRSATPNNQDPDGRLGVLGDRFTVNGQIQPKLTVLRRKYRFRLLNAGPSRFYQFFLTKDGEDQAFVQIGNDESLLEQRYEVPPQDGVLVSVAERADVVIDFSRFQKGKKLFLVNRLVMQDEGFGPVAEFDAEGTKFLKYKTLPPGQGDQLLCFEVGGDATDPSQVPPKLRPNPALPTVGSVSLADLPSDKLKSLPNYREFRFGLDDVNGDTWVINKRPFDPSPAGAAVIDQTVLKAGSLITPRSRIPGELPDGEVWTIRNDDGSNWAHPVHIHAEEFRILRRNGQVPPAYERSKKDVLRLDPAEEVQVFVRFRDFLGKYPMHCHNVLHEDHKMMHRFDVVGDH
jgi:FtsP/CotA-like multicopper oxidase with cupredoxin domain